MKRILFACLLATLVASLSSPAQAQVIYASPAGTGTTCTASAPCALDTAINLAGGVSVACIDGGLAFLSKTINQSLVIDCPGGVVSGSSSGSAVLLLTGSSGQIVKLRNLTFAGAGNAGTTPPFIRVTGGATLIIENCKFEDEGVNNTGGGTPIAVQFAPSSPAAQLIIRDTVFANNGTQLGVGGGLQVAPTGSGSASVSLERVSFNYNITSMVLSGPVNATMIDSTMQASRSNGILVGSGATLDIKDSTLMYNVGSAVSVSSGGTLRLSNNDIKGNQIGVSNNGGQALSFKNNRIFANGSTAALGTIQGGQ